MELERAPERAFSPAQLVEATRLKPLMRRRDGPALLRLAVLLITQIATGMLVYRSLDSVWLLPAMALHGFVLVHMFSLQHECSHMTAFKSRPINNWLAAYCGLVMCIPPRYFQLEHTQHHTYTQNARVDPQHIPLPRSFSAYLLYLSALPYWRAQLGTVLRLTAGRLRPDEVRFISASQQPKVIREARIMLAIYTGIALLSWLFSWTWPLYLWLAPLLIAEPAMRFIRMTEHVGRPLVPDLTKNTRTCKVAWPLRILCWNMNYHAEHHVAPSVPFHALPKLHAAIGDQLPTYTGYFAAHRAILRQLR